MKRRAEQGLPTPAWDNRPLLEPENAFVWNTFQQLNRTRSYSSSGPNKITVTEMQSYFDLVGLRSDTARYEMFELITAIDDAYIEYKSKRSKEKKSDNGGSN